MADLAAGCRSNVWYEEIIPEDSLGSVKTMLSLNERQMLHWMAREMDLTTNGCIVDAGCFLGGSTLSFATGLAANKSQGSKKYRIHTYDIFITPNHEYSIGLIGNDRKPGDSVLDIFTKNLGHNFSSVLVNSGDFMEATPPARPIDILFVDITKTRELNAKIILEFFPLLIPGKSIVIQQDHNDHSCPWANATMEYLSKYFEVLCDESSSRVFRLKKRIPAFFLRRAARMQLGQEFDMLQRLVAKEASAVPQYFAAMTAAWTVLEKDGAKAAIKYIDELPLSQPWESEPPYAHVVKQALGWIGSAEGLENFHTGYFSARAS